MLVSAVSKDTAVIACARHMKVVNAVLIDAGSSSGSGVAVAARIAPFALCEDTGGNNIQVVITDYNITAHCKHCLARLSILCHSMA